MTWLIILILGLCVGSFINVLICRLDKKGGIWFGRSECPQCLCILKWPELIPVFSFIFLKGKCRSCKNKISLVYPVVEVLTGFIFLHYFYMNGLDSLKNIYDLLIITILVSIVLFDYFYFIIPDKVIYPLILLVFAYQLSQRVLWNNVFTALMLGLIFVILYWGSHGRWLGLGDAKLVFSAGLMFGYPLTVLLMFSSMWVAAIAGLWLIALKRATLKTALPFGSFLASFSILFIIFQNELQKIVKIFT